MDEKTVIVTGLRGMDGSYLTEQLISLGYKVYGLIRRSSQGLDLGNSKHLAHNPNLEVVEGDLLDLSCLAKLCKTTRPDLLFNTAAQSHVHTSFEQPIFTMEVNSVGVLNCLEAIRLSGIHTKFLQCSTSEMYGGLAERFCNEYSTFHPRSPYGVSKVAAHYLVQNYREAYKMFACCSICFNHEGPRRGPNFVSRKITQAAARISQGLQDKLFLGNLNAKRDWGFAGDFTQGMILMLTKSPTPKDYVLATGETHTVREFCEIAFSHVGLDWKQYVEVDPCFYRPAEVDVLIGDASSIKEDLGWKPQVTFPELVKMMVDYDLSQLDDKLNP